MEGFSLVGSASFATARHLPRCLARASFVAKGETGDHTPATETAPRREEDLSLFTIFACTFMELTGGIGCSNLPYSSIKIKAP